MIDPIVLVLTMGRVGSTSAYAALARAGVQAFHVHHLNPLTLAALTPRRLRKSAPAHVQRGQAARVLLAQDLDRPVKIITLVRDPLARNLSSGFAIFRKRGEPEVLHEKIGDPEFTDRIWRWVDFDLPERWFDDEVRDVAGIDVFAQPFPDVGHERYTKRHVELLVMRSDLPDLTKSELVSDLLDQKIEIGSNNSQTRAGGPLRHLYDAFQATAPIGRDEVVALARSRISRHFLDVDEELYVREWCQRLGID